MRYFIGAVELPAFYAPGGFAGTVLGLDARTADFLQETPDKKLSLPLVLAPVPKFLDKAPVAVQQLTSGLVNRINSNRINDAKKAAVVRETARATSVVNAPYLKERAAEDLAALRLNTKIGQTSAGKAGIDWGLLPAVVGLGVGAATGGPAGAVAGARAGIKYSGANNASLTLGNVAGDVGTQVGAAMAHTVLETTELGELAEEGKQIIKEGVDVTREAIAAGREMRAAINNTVALATAGDRPAAESVAMLTGALQERADGVTREVIADRTPLAPSDFFRSMTPADAAALDAAALDFFRPEWAVMADGEVVRIVGAGKPPGARWIVREGRVKRA